MPTSGNLMGLGMSHLLAARVGMHVVSITCAGQTAAGATQIPGRQGFYFCNASNSGSGLALPKVGGDGAAGGALLGDMFGVLPYGVGTIYIYANANDAGSAVTLIGRGVSAAGTTGISLAVGSPGYFQPITVSTWMYIASV